MVVVLAVGTKPGMNWQFALPMNLSAERGIYAASTSPRARPLERHKCRAPVQGFNARKDFRGNLTLSLSRRTRGGTTSNAAAPASLSSLSWFRMIAFRYWFVPSLTAPLRWVWELDAPASGNTLTPVNANQDMNGRFSADWRAAPAFGALDATGSTAKLNARDGYPHSLRCDVCQSVGPLHGLGFVFDGLELSHSIHGGERCTDLRRDFEAYFEINGTLQSSDSIYSDMHDLFGDSGRYQG